MIPLKYSMCERQKQFLSIKNHNSRLFLNNLPLGRFKYQIEHLSSYSNFDTQISSIDLYSDEMIPIYSPKREFADSVFSNTTIIPAFYNQSMYSDRCQRESVHDLMFSSASIYNKSNPIHGVIDERVIQGVKQKINTLYDKYQSNNWDGYDAEPLQYLQQSLKFIDAFLFESILLVDTLDIVPENDGCLCFEWFKSEDNFISISVKNDQLIYNYKIEAEEGCGETNFHGRQMLIEKIRKLA